MAWRVGGAIQAAVTPSGIRVPIGDVTVPATYALEAGSYLSLALRYAAEDAADAKTTPPVTWSAENTGGAGVLTSSVATGGVHTNTHGTTSTTWGTSTRDAPRFYQVMRAPSGALRVIARFQTNLDANFEAVALLVSLDEAASSTYVGAGLVWNGNGDGSSRDAFFIGAKDAVSQGSLDADSVFTAQEITDGVWIMLEREPNGTIWHASYSAANQATPPTSWTEIGTGITVSTLDTTVHRVGWYSQTQNTSGAHVASMVYFDASSYGDPERQDASSNLAGTGGGFEDSDPAIQLLTDLDIGAAATLADADLQAALAVGENTRYGETASWTWSCVRSATEGAAAGAYAASGSVTVSGSGRYLNLRAKCSSDAETRGSLHLPSLHIPYT